MDPLSPVSMRAARSAEDAGRAEDARREEELRGVATRFEAVFLAQMMQHAGAGKASEAFGGGAGEEAFRGHLVAEQAKLMAAKGGVGLAEKLFEALARREGLDE